MTYKIFPFDQIPNNKASIDDIDKEAIRDLIRQAKLANDFKLTPRIHTKTLLKHLNLTDERGILTNAAILLFGKHPQKIFISSSVMCVQFYESKIERPIQHSQLIEGNLFELIEQSTNFVMSNIEGEATQIPAKAIHEAIAYAVSHRDYTSNASVQVMLLKDRLEIWQPGKNTPDAHQNNARIAQMMQLRGFIPKNNAKLMNSPIFQSGVDFRTIIWKNKA